MFQAAFDALQGVANELVTVQENLDRRGNDPECKGEERFLVDEARAQSEKTYLLHLLAEFEGTLTRLGPSLSTPTTFGPMDGLAHKLNRIGAHMNVDLQTRNRADQDLREHRNEPAHGRTPVPRVGFGTTHEIMKAFLRYCH